MCGEYINRTNYLHSFISFLSSAASLLISLCKNPKLIMYKVIMLSDSIQIKIGSINFGFILYTFKVKGE